MGQTWYDGGRRGRTCDNRVTRRSLTYYSPCSRIPMLNDQSETALSSTISLTPHKVRCYCPSSGSRRGPTGPAPCAPTASSLTTDTAHGHPWGTTLGVGQRNAFPPRAPLGACGTVPPIASPLPGGMVTHQRHLLGVLVAGVRLPYLPLPPSPGTELSTTRG